MKRLSLLILFSIMMLTLTFAGRAIFGMGDEGMMNNLECLNHCVEQTVTPTVMPMTSAFVFVALVLFAGAFFRLVQTNTQTRFFHTYARLTEPIRLFALKKQLSSVIILD